MKKLSVLSLLVVLALCVSVPVAFGQSLVTGDIAGTVSDPSHAVVPNAPVALKNNDTGAAQNTTTNSTGFYRFTLLKPGNYTVTVSQSGFATTQQPTTVQVGTTTTANVMLQVSKQSTTVEVSEVAPVINPSPSVNTSFSQLEVSQLPNPGGDITTIAETAPGVIVNSTGGYGNFTVNGMPATSNLFTVNGENDMDPYFNINNSGATNLTLGANEVQEATITANPYSGEYGQLAGAQVTYVTKSGTNTFHGNAQYWWNGREMNANNWMTNYQGQPTSFSNANQWAGSIGGPIIKNSTFFFFDTEGMRFVLPNVNQVVAPSPDFANAVLANVAALQGTSNGEYTTYQKLFGLYAGAPGASGASPYPNSQYCAPGALNLPGFNPATQNCFVTFNSVQTALAKEWIIASRVDQKIGNNDNLFGRFKIDHGVQPTTLDAINPAFDALSNQPSWDVQAQETHVFGPRSTNAFTATLSHYVAQFQQDPASVAAAWGGTPYGIYTSSPVPMTTFNLQGSFPQGRNITQYQFIDDFTLNRGKHNWKFGVNFRRYDVSDHNFFFQNPGAYFGYTGAGLQELADGLAYQYRQLTAPNVNVPVALWGVGFYGMDEWNVTSNLKLTLALRMEYNSNPVCQTNCFSNFVGSIANVPSFNTFYNGGDPTNVPYNQDINGGLHQAYPGVDSIDMSPRIGFSWSPGGSGKTVVSGGFGIFYDNPPAGLVDNELSNPPTAVQIRVRPENGTPAFDTTSTGSAATFQASAAAFNSGFAAGQTYTQIANELANLGVAFAAPAFTATTGTIHAPRWQEWNFQVQREINPVTAFVLNYVGNHGINIPYENSWWNAYDCCGLYGGIVPFSPAVPNYGTVTTIQSGAVSNYNGVTLTLKRQFSHWVSAHFNYTWSHNLDEVSNGGIFTYGDSLPLQQNNPNSLRQGNYGNSDYDVRHAWNADFVVHPDFHVSSGIAKQVLNGWEWSGKVLWRTGLPFTVVDGNWNGAVFNSNTTIFAAQSLPGAAPGQLSCGEGAASPIGTAPGSCLNPAAFIDSASGSFLGYPCINCQQSRNQYHGPHFFDFDMALYKTFKFGERVNFGIGAQAFNVFNHPNFYQPDNYLGDSTFGQISSMTTVPTSPYGNFLGFDSSPRVVQLSMKIVF